MRRWRSGRRALLGVVAVLLLLGTACSKSSNPATDTSPPATNSPTGAATAQTVDQGAGGQLVFDPSTFSVKTGDTITVSNVGTLPHTFTITGQDVDVTNSPGDSQDVTIDLAPGTYPFICKFHQSRGMTGTLTVTS